MPGVSFVSADYYRRHLAALRDGFAELQRAEIARRHDLAARVRFHARCLMRSDGGADVTAAERDEAFRLIDTTAGYIVRHGLTEGDARRAELARLGL